MDTPPEPPSFEVYDTRAPTPPLLLPPRVDGPAVVLNLVTGFAPRSSLSVAAPSMQPLAAAASRGGRMTRTGSGLLTELLHGASTPAGAAGAPTPPASPPLPGGSAATPLELQWLQGWDAAPGGPRPQPPPPVPPVDAGLPPPSGPWPPRPPRPPSPLSPHRALLVLQQRLQPARAPAATQPPLLGSVGGRSLSLPDLAPGGCAAAASSASPPAALSLLLPARLLSRAAAPPPRRVSGFTAVLLLAAAPSARPPAFPAAKRSLPFSAELPPAPAEPPLPAPAQPPQPPLRPPGPPSYHASVALDGSGLPAGPAGGGRLRVPPRCDLTLVLSNPEGTPLHAFRLRLDAAAALAAAPPHLGVRLYWRQRTLAAAAAPPPAGCGAGSAAAAAAAASAAGAPRFALQLRMVASPCAPPAHAAAEAAAGGGADGSAAAAAPAPPLRRGARRLYLHGDLRVAFLCRAVEGDGEGTETHTEGPLVEAG